MGLNISDKAIKEVRELREDDEKRRECSDNPLRKCPFCKNDVEAWYDHQEKVYKISGHEHDCILEGVSLNVNDAYELAKKWNGWA